MNLTQTQTQSLRIAIADDHQIFIDGLTTVLTESIQWSVKIVATANNGDALLPLLKRTTPDILLLDMNMPGKDGLEVLKDIKGKYPDMKIIVMSMYDDSKIVKEVLKLGAQGYLLKTAGSKVLMIAISEVLDNATYIDANIAKGQLNMPIGSHDSHNVPYDDKFITKYELTKREIEILRLIALAMNNKDIGAECYISEQTVGVHRKNIMRKLGVNSTAALIKLAYDNNLV